MTRHGSRTAIIVVGLAIIFLAAPYQSVIAQADGCSKPTVAVRVWEIFDYPDYEDRGIGSVYDELNRREFKQKEDWAADIQAAVLAELRKHSPGTQFISNGTDCDYHFRYIICNYPVNYYYPDDSLEENPIEVAGFLMMSCFGTERVCVRNRYLIDCESSRETADRELVPAIAKNIWQYRGEFDRIIDRWETVRHPAPPRGPSIRKFQDRDYVSPLEEETDQQIKVQVTDCRGNLVADRKHKWQKVFYQKETARGELKADREFNVYPLVDNQCSSGSVLCLTLYQTTGVAAKYTLQKGLEPSLDSVEIRTCGIDREDVDTAEVKIMGLDLKAKARMKEIFPMQSTQIDIDFNRIDTKGGKIPINGKTIEIKVRGLVDGTVIPQGDVVTNSQGRATLTYTAGEEDEEVTFEAKYQPKKFKEFVKDKAKVKVLKFDRLCQITRKSGHTTSYTKTEGSTVSTLNWTETSEITISMTFMDNPRVDISFDPATMQSKPRRYVYYVDDYWISSSYHTGSGSREETVGSGAHIQRHISSSNNQNGTFQDLQPNNDDARMTITVDPATGKATEIGLPSFGAVISIMSQSDCDGEKRVEGRMEPFDCSSTNQFTKGFSVYPFREKWSEISGGDGIKVIRGQYHENKTTSQGSKEESFEWVIYIKK